MIKRLKYLEDDDLFVETHSNLKKNDIQTKEYWEWKENVYDDTNRI